VLPDQPRECGRGNLHIAACIHWLQSYRVRQIHYKFFAMEEMTVKELREKLGQQ